MLMAELKALHAIARCGSVTKAAVQLGVSQPTVTAQLRQLEARYGVELFHRQGRGMQLSAEGQGLMPMVDRLLQQESEIEFRLRDAGTLRQGSLRVGATGPFYVMDTVQRYHGRYPDVGLTLSIGNSQAMLQALHDYRIEIATLAFRVDDERLHRQTIAIDPVRLVLHCSHPLARGRDSVALLELDGHTLLLREPGSMTRQLGEAMLREAGIRPRRVLEIGSRESIRQAVLCGLGVSLMPSREIPGHPELVALAVAGSEVRMHEYLYCLHDRRPVQTIARFVEMAPDLH